MYRILNSSKSLDLQKVCPYLNSMSAAADPVQLVADEPLTDGAHPLGDGPPAAHLQLLRRRVELRAHRVSDQRLLHDLPGCVCKLLSTSANCKYFYKITRFRHSVHRYSLRPSPAEIHDGHTVSR